MVKGEVGAWKSRRVCLPKSFFLLSPLFLSLYFSRSLLEMLTRMEFPRFICRVPGDSGLEGDEAGLEPQLCTGRKGRLQGFFGK